MALGLRGWCCVLDFFVEKVWYKIAHIRTYGMLWLVKKKIMIYLKPAHLAIIDQH